MALQDYQMTYNGLTFGMGNPIGIIEVVGFDDFDAQLGDSPIPRGSGDVPGLGVARSRGITLHLSARGPKRSQELADLLNLAYVTFNLSQTPLPLALQDPEQPERFVNCRVVGRTLQRNATLTHGFHPFSVHFRAADPRFYGAESLNQGLGIYDASGGGLDYLTGPFSGDYSKDYEVDTSASVVVENDGNADAYPVIVFFGPPTGTLTGATLTNLTNGAVADFTFTSPLLTGGTFTADMGRIVTADPGPVPFISQGGTNRYGDWELPRSPFFLSPGSNELRYEITGTTTDATASVTWRDTSL